MPPALAAAAALLLALLLAIRFAFWKPLRALGRIDIGIMYIGYLGITAQLVVQALAQLGVGTWTGSVPVHLFSFGVMGTVIPAMLIRISKGHTGRKVMFDALDRAVLYLMLAALALRIVAPQLLPAAYLLWLQLAAACWVACFAHPRLALYPLPAACARGRQGALSGPRAPGSAALRPLPRARTTTRGCVHPPSRHTGPGRPAPAGRPGRDARPAGPPARSSR